MSLACAFSSLRRAVPLLALLAAGAGGCVDNDVSITIDKFIPPGDDCTYDPGVEVIQGSGVYDAVIGKAYGAPYFVGLVLTNNLPANTTVPVEVQAYYLQSFDVELQVTGPADAVIAAADRSFNTPVSTVRIEPAGKVAAILDIIKPHQLDALASDAMAKDTEIVVRTRPILTRAEEKVEGAWANFPLRVCNGCLLAVLGACPLMKAATPEGNACNPAADRVVGCCSQSGNLFCGGDAPVKTM